jgi:putative sterol carrier protein
VPVTTIREVFEDMPRVFQKSAAAGLKVVIQFDITGDGGGKWYAAIDDGALQVDEGAHDKPTLTITANATDYLAISNGSLNAQLAFMTGRIRASGDLGLAMKMPALFKA